MAKVDEIELLRKHHWIGFAEVYLDRCFKETATCDNVDIEVYTNLTVLDAALGTTASEQLFGCLKRTTRMDIIKVRNETKVN